MSEVVKLSQSTGARERGGKPGGEALLPRPQHEFPFNAQHPNALAIYCSDGRFTRAVEMLAEEALEHTRLDTLTIPGGPGTLSLQSGGYQECEHMRRAASFLITGHHIETVILVAHEGCGWYREKMGFYPPDTVRERQVADLRDTAQWVQQKHPNTELHLFYAHSEEDTLHFERIHASPGA